MYNIYRFTTNATVITYDGKPSQVIPRTPTFLRCCFACPAFSQTRLTTHLSTHLTIHNNEGGKGGTTFPPKGRGRRGNLGFPSPFGFLHIDCRTTIAFFGFACIVFFPVVVIAHIFGNFPEFFAA